VASSFETFAQALRFRLRARGYDLREATTLTDEGELAPVRVRFPEEICDRPFFAIGDVHLGDGGAGDVFRYAPGFTGDDKARRLEGTLLAMKELREAGAAFSIVQIGDWFDVWRGVLAEQPTDVRDLDVPGYEPIYRAYPRLLVLDTALGVLHAIGNHDAAFVKRKPDYRPDVDEAFALGHWMDRDGRRVFALHGHQLEALVPPPNELLDEWAVSVATILACASPEVAEIEYWIDRRGAPGVIEAIEHAFFHCKGGVDEPPPEPVAKLEPPPPTPAGPLEGTFVWREHADTLVAVASHVPAVSGEEHELALVVVGHSHHPRVSYAELDDRPVVVLDVGAWVYRQSHVALVAGDTAAVFEVVPRDDAATTESSREPSAASG
jgi:UDP-2,3-diacylglucosamine pyrophosphatase LpxH